MAECHLFIEWIGGGDGFEVALIELIGDFEDMNGDWFAGFGEGLAVLDEEADVSCGFSCGGEGVGVDGGVGFDGDGEIGDAGFGGARVVDDVGSRASGVLDEGFHGGGEAIDGPVP